MGHHSRYDAFLSLVKLVKADAWAQDDGTRGENANSDVVWGRLAKLTSDWSVVIQDDAVIDEHFRENVADALRFAPQTAVSFYVGTTRPRQEQVLHAIAEADRDKLAWLSSDALLWGVAVAMPTSQIAQYLEWAPRMNEPYDRRIGLWFNRQGKDIMYTWPSLADHSDVPSILDAQGRRSKRVGTRVAHRIGVPETWDTRSARIHDVGARLR